MLYNVIVSGRRFIHVMSSAHAAAFFSATYLSLKKQRLVSDKVIRRGQEHRSRIAENSYLLWQTSLNSCSHETFNLQQQMSLSIPLAAIITYQKQTTRWLELCNLMLVLITNKQLRWLFTGYVKQLLAVAILIYQKQWA